MATPETMVQVERKIRYELEYYLTLNKLYNVYSKLLDRERYLYRSLQGCKPKTEEKRKLHEAKMEQVDSNIRTDHGKVEELKKVIAEIEARWEGRPDPDDYEVGPTIENGYQAELKPEARAKKVDRKPVTPKRNTPNKR